MITHFFISIKCVYLYQYKSRPKDDVLVKVLLNEEEVTLPLPKTSTPYYYKWSDFKKYYLAKLNAYRG